MGKKKTKVKFIDKKNAISFHLVAKADHGGEEEDGVEDEQSERAELNEQLKQQKAEARERAGLAPKDQDEEDDEGEESFIPPPANDDRINILNLAAEAEGVETRAVRQAKKALKESKTQKFYLQPNFIPGKGDVQIPKDFPQEHLYTGEVDPKEEEYWAKEDRRKWELEQQANAPSLLPHNYDYSQHLRPISGRGVFMEAKRGDELYDAEHDPRERDAKPVSKAKANAGASSSAAAAASSSSSSSGAAGSLSLHDESKGQEEDDDDMPPLGAAGGDGDDETPVNPALLASVERLQRKLVKQGRRVKVEKDFVVALEGDKEEEFEALQDDFVMQAMMGAVAADGAAEEDEEEYEDGEEEYYEDGEEYYEDEEEEEEQKSGGGKTAAAGGRKPPTEAGIQSAMQRFAAAAAAAARRGVKENSDDEGEDGEDGEDEDEDARPNRPIDDAFDKLLEDEYSDGEIGELDHYQDEDPSALEGTLELEDVVGELDEFLEAKLKFKSQGGSIIDKVEPALQDLTLSKLALVTAGEKTLKEIEQDITDMLNPPVRDTWDAESILSTYSNMENHPRVLREPRRNKAKQIQVDLSASSSRPNNRQNLATFQAPLPIPERALRKDALDAHNAATADQEDEEEEDEDDEEEGTAESGENKGKARATDETPEEKKKRKQAVKLAKREAKGRKKQLKTLYVQETAAAMTKQARLNKANPPGVKKL